ncbi:MAG: hypothetical protein HOP29_14075 [Phycisphaerales bacterium]|nr:hypothetical protein [Phycisphaerales bacterium]
MGPGANGWGDADDNFGKLSVAPEFPGIDSGDDTPVAAGELDIVGAPRRSRAAVVRTLDAPPTERHNVAGL